MNRGELVEDIINNLYGVKKGKLVFREDKEDKLLSYIGGYLYLKVKTDLDWILDYAPDFEQHYMVGLQDLLLKSKVLNTYEHFKNNECDRKILCGYLKSSLSLRVRELINEEDGTKRLKLDKVNHTPVRLETTSLDKEVYGDTMSGILSSDMDYLANRERVETNKSNIEFLKIKDKVLTKHQLWVYNSMVEDYDEDVHAIREVGYKSKGDYFESKGINSRKFKTFTENVPKRVEGIYKEEWGDNVIKNQSLVVAASRIVSIVEREEHSEEEINFLVSKVISENYEDEGFEVAITKGFDFKEKRDIVRLVKTFSGEYEELKHSISKGFKVEGNIKGDDCVEYLSNKTMYKVVNNAYKVREDEIKRSKEEELKRKKEENKTRESKEEVKKAVVPKVNNQMMNLTPYGYVGKERHTR